MDRYKVLDKCIENLTKAKLVIEKPDINQIVKIMTQPLINRIEQIQKICSVDKYNLCFIGEVGVGKSTAITNLLGLIERGHLNVGSKLIDVPLLKTAEGRTTLCETEICFINGVKTRIEVQGLDYLKFKEIVAEFCLKVLKNNESAEDGLVKCSSEVQRAIKNMSGFPTRDKDKQNTYIKETLGSKFSEEKEFYELAKEAILKKVQYQTRTKKEILYLQDVGLESWIKSTLFKINDGEIIDVPYPSKITLIIDPENLNVSIPDFIENVRDTKGIDGSGVREDINQICRDVKNICIICDGIKDYGNIVSEGFLKNQFIPQNKDLKYRNFVLGLEQGAQLSKANEADGRESGKDIKKEEAINNWNGICLDEYNMLFYNAFFGIKYESDEQKILSVDLKKYDNERIALLKTIESRLNVMYEEYSKELSDINQKLNIFMKNIIEDYHKEKLTEIRCSVGECLQNLTDNYDLFFERLNNEIRYKTQAGYIRGSVNRNGVYGNYNFYSQAKEVSYEEFDKTAKSPLFHLDKECERVFINNDMMDEALQLAIKYRISELYNKYRDKNATDYETILMENILEDKVWKEMFGYWGNKIIGYKYRDRIADTLFGLIKNKDILKDIMDKENTYKFFRELNQFLDITLV